MVELPLFGKEQGSNLALANLLVVFKKKQVEITITCYL